MLVHDYVEVAEIVAGDVDPAGGGGVKSKILFMAPSLSSVSELWLGRMIRGLGDDIGLLTAWSCDQKRWDNQIPIVPLLQKAAWGRTWCHRLGLPVETDSLGLGSQAVVREAKAAGITAIFSHYLDFTLKCRRVWEPLGLPLFVHCHGYDVTWNYRKHTSPDLAFFQPSYIDAVKQLAQRAILVANSHATAQRLVTAGIPAERIVVKHIGVPVPPQPPRHSDRTSNVQILYLGRLVDFKGPDLMIRAFELACERGLDGSLTIAGDGELRAACELLRARSRFKDRMRFLGATDADTGSKLRREADIFTAHNCCGPLTMQEEALGVGFIEAMADGLPVVSGANGSLPEVVADGRTGILVAPGDVDSHAKAFVQLGHDPEMRRRMGAAGWQRAQELFPIEKEVAHLKRLFMEKKKA